MKNDSKPPRKAYSCERRRDYITILGLGLFVLVVAFELYLVLWVPVQLKSRGALEKAVAKQEMIDLADNLRDAIPRIEKKNNLNEGELMLTKASLDVLALYIRENQERLSREQIRELSEILGRFDALARDWSSGRFLIKEETLDYANTIAALKAKAGIASERRPDERKEN